jgi:signal transduction histidine kinase
VASAIHYMMVLNPAIEIYVLDSLGRILAFFAEGGRPLALERVDLGPVRDFLADPEDLPIYGDDPRSPGEKTHFSAAELELGAGETGYLYVVLRSSLYDAAQEGLGSSLVGETLRDSLVITVPLVALLGLLAFFLVTRRLETLSRTVRAFGSEVAGSQEKIRARVSSRDEIGELARSFNQMADTIEANLRKLEAADRTRRELVANISHDLRNPLASIRGYTETLMAKDSELSPEERRRYLRISLDRAAALSRLIDGLFELSKLEAPDIRPKPERFSLAELVQDVVMHLRHEATSNDVSLAAEEPQDLFFVVADLQMIERVLINLIDNPIRHSPARGAGAHLRPLLHIRREPAGSQEGERPRSGYSQAHPRASRWASFGRRLGIRERIRLRVAVLSPNRLIGSRGTLQGEW